MVTVAVESGATSFDKGIEGNCELASPISLLTVPWERSKKINWQTLLCWKEEAREVGLHRALSGSTGSLKNTDTPPLEKSPEKRVTESQKKKKKELPAMHGNCLVIFSQHTSQMQPMLTHLTFQMQLLPLPFSLYYWQGGSCAFSTRVLFLISVSCFILNLSNLFYVLS